MESLAAIFVSIVLAANSVAPQTHISQKLGVYPIDTTPPVVLSVEDEALPSASPSANIEQVREQRRKTIEAAQTRRTEALAGAASKRKEFKEKVSVFRDEAKKRIVTHLDEVMAKQNERWVEHWNNVLTKLSEIVARIEARGADVVVAKAAIVEAQAAVTGQGSQVYTIGITSEATLREDVAPVAADFKADLRATQAKVKAAREAVHAAFKSIQNKEPQEGGENEAQ